MGTVLLSNTRENTFEDKKMLLSMLSASLVVLVQALSCQRRELVAAFHQEHAWHGPGVVFLDVNAPRRSTLHQLTLTNLGKTLLLPTTRTEPSMGCQPSNSTTSSTMWHRNGQII